MNETYWVVVMQDGNLAYWTMDRQRNRSLQKYLSDFIAPKLSPMERRRWSLIYRKGARCKKVRLVLEE